MRNPTTTTLLLLALTSTGALASAQQTSTVKTPRAVPDEADIKTPEPPFSAEGSLRMDEPTRAPSARTKVSPPATASTDLIPHHVIDHVYLDTTADGTIWARGRTYKASFDTEGATYVPFFGSQAPANHPVRFTTSAVSIGSVHLDCGKTAAVKNDGSIAFAHEGFVERWQMQLDGLEQQFVFDALPAPGDLVIRIDTQSDLEPSAESGAIAFSNELGRVDYGAAVAVDARGARFPMTSSFADGSIELHLGLQDLEHVVLPLVVDPLISTFTLLNPQIDGYRPDVAYDAAHDRYIVVYEEAYSATDHDVFAEMHDSAGSYVDGHYIDFGFDYWSAPRVANNALVDTFLCVAAVGAPGSLRQIHGRIFDAATANMSGQFVIAGADGFDKAAPDVGGDPALVGPTYFFVVWERYYTTNDHDVHGRMVLIDGSLAGSGPILIDNSSFTLDTAPSISKCDGNPPFATQEWTIVWQRYTSGVGHNQVFGAQRHWDGSATHNTFPIDATGDVTNHPRVSSLLDGDGVTRPYMVVYESDNPFGDIDIDGVVMIGTAFQVGTNIPNYVDDSTFHLDQLNPCVDSDGLHFTAVYMQSDPNGMEDYDLVAADLVYAGDYPYVCEGGVIASTPDAERHACITSAYSGGGARRHFLIGWDTRDNPTYLSQVNAAFFDGCEGGFTEAFCFGDGTATGCPCGNVGGPGNGCANSFDPNGANLTSSGNPQISADTFVLQASGMPHGGTALYFQGLPPPGGYYGAVFGDGIRCIATQIRRIGAKSSPNGSSQYPEAGDPHISVSGLLPAAGGETFYQLWYRNAGPYCTASPFNLTNGLRVVWAP